MSLTALLLLLLPPAFGQDGGSPSVDVAQEADLHFNEGTAAYRAGRFTEALEHLLLANRLVPNRNVVFNVARTYEQLGKFDEAFRHYSDFVALEPDPERRAAAERAIDRIRDRVALVRVESDPPGARVYVDRVDLGARGTTPIVLALTPGDQRILVQLQDHQPAEGTAAVVLGAQATVELKLEPILGEVVLTGSPAGAEVRLGAPDGPLLGSLPGTVQAPPGNQTLVLSAPGYRSARQSVQVQPDRSVAVTVDLEELTGTLVVNTIERGALVEIDGQPVGFTPVVLTVAAGSHAVAVRLQGYHPAVQELTLEVDQSVTVDVPLRSLREVMAATRSVQSVDEAPASVTLIDGREIRAFGYQSLYQALSNVRGVYPTHDLTYPYLGFRGFSTPGDYGNRVLVTVDGHTMNDDQLGASYVGNDFSTDLGDVAQIEVVRGPGSALYGSNAFFGVINAVTHGPGSSTRPHVAVSGDSDATLRARAGSGFGGEAVGGWISAAGLASQGRSYTFEEFAGTRRGNPTGLSEGQDWTRARTLHGRLWLGDLELQGFHHGREKAIPTGAFGTRLADDRAVASDYRSFGEARYSPDLGDAAELSVRAWLDAYSYQGAFPYGVANVWVDRWRGLWAGAEPRLVVHPADWLNLTVGAETRQHFSASLTSFQYEDLANDVLKSDVPANDERPTFAVYSTYAIAELVGGDWLRLSAGGRLDVFDTAAAIDDDATAFNPRVALILTPTERNVLKLMGGTAFRAPSVYEYLYTDGGVTQVKPQSLEPETVLTVEGEYTHRFDDQTALTLDVYHNRIAQLVDTEVLPSGVFRYANTGLLTQTLGGEIELRRDWQGGWMAAVQHSAQDTRTGSLIDGQGVVNSPTHVFGIKGALPVVAGEATLAGVLRSEAPRQALDGSQTEWAHLVDLTLTGDVARLGSEWALGVRNVLDWKQEHPSGPELRMGTVPQPGRSAFFSVRTAF